MNNETKKEKKSTGKKIAVGVAAVVAVAAIAVPTTLALTGKDSASANAGNKYTIMVSTSLDTVADYTLSVESGTKISTLRTMLKAIDGYNITGIYKDENLTTEYSDDEYISEDTKIFIKFEAKTYTVKVYDENKQNPTTEEVNHGEALNLTAPENKETNLGTYKFLGYYTVVGDTQVDLNRITSDLEIYPKFEIEYKEYSFGYSFGDGNDYSSSIKVSVGGEEKTLNDTYHYGSTIKLRAVPSTGYEVSEFKVTVAGQTTDLLTYAYMVVEDGNLYYETELAGNGNVTITYSEVAKQAYSIGTIPDGIKVTRNGTTLANDSAIYFGDELEISQYEDFTVSDFEITNAKHALGNTYYVTGNTEITATTTYAYSYLTLTEIDGGYEITKCNDSAITEISLPNTYKEQPVISVGVQAFQGCQKLTSITISPNIQTINRLGFATTSIEEIYVPSTVKTLAYGAFGGTSSLKTIVVGAENIDQQAFGGCSNITSVEFLGTVKAIPAAFAPAGSCFNLKNVILREGVESIGASAFSGCRITSIKLPSTLTSIGDSAFSGVSNLYSITIPGSVKTIGKNAFLGCSLYGIFLSEGLESVGESAFSGSYAEYANFPSTLTSIGKGAFSGPNFSDFTINSSEIYESLDTTILSISVLKEIKVLKTLDLGTNEFLNSNFVLASTDGDYNVYVVGKLVDETDMTFTEVEGGYEVSNLLKRPQDRQNYVIEIPETYNGKPVISIAADSFRNRQITGIILPKSVNILAENAFVGNNLSIIIVEEGNETFTSRDSSGSGVNAIIEKTTKTMILGGTNTVVPTDGSVKKIEKEVLNKLSVAKDFVIPEEIEVCDSIIQSLKITIINSELYHLATTENILGYAVEVRVLKSIDDGTNTYLNSEYKLYDDGEYNLYKRGVLDLESNYTFTEVEGGYEISKYNGELPYLILPETYNSKPIVGIGDRAFGEKDMIKNIILPNSLKYIGDDAFNYCSKLLQIIIPEGVETIYRDTFDDCNNLIEVILPSTLKTGNTEFEYVNSIRKVTIKNAETYNWTAYDDYSQRAGHLILYATEVRVLKTIVDDPANSNIFLNCGLFEISEDGDYYVYTRVSA